MKQPIKDTVPPFIDIKVRLNFETGEIILLKPKDPYIEKWVQNRLHASKGDRMYIPRKEVVEKLKSMKFPEYQIKTTEQLNLKIDQLIISLKGEG